MRAALHNREKAETVRKRGFGLSRSVLCIALSLTLVIGCIPHDDVITSAKAEGLVPVAVGVGAATATALGITEAELVLGIMTMLGVGLGMQMSFNDMYESIDASTNEINLEDYQTNYVDWRSKGIDIPNWGDLGAAERDSWGGWAWRYDEAVWLGYWMKYVGINPTGDGPNDPNNTPRDNKKWNTLKSLAKGGTAIAALELANLYVDDFINMLFTQNDASVGLLGINDATYNGYSLPYVVFQAEYTDATVPNRGQINYDSWPIGCIEYMLNGNERYVMRIYYYWMYNGTNGNYQNTAPTYDVVYNPSISGWQFKGQTRGTYTNFVAYDVANDSLSSQTSNTLNANTNYKLGHNYSYNGGNVYQDLYYFINPNYVAGYNYIDENNVPVNLVGEDSIYYGQAQDFPSEQAQNIFNDDSISYNNYWVNMQPSDPEKTVTIKNPYYDGIYNPQWQDYFNETNSEDVFPIPDTQPDNEPFPETPEQPSNPSEPDYDLRLQRIADLAFSQAFPFCLINDIRLISQKIVMVGNSEPDFSVTIPLEDFGIEGMDEIVLNANHPDSGGGLIDIGDYTRPIFTVLFIALLLGFSIKLFLR